MPRCDYVVGYNADLKLTRCQNPVEVEFEMPGVFSQVWACSECARTAKGVTRWRPFGKRKWLAPPITTPRASGTTKRRPRAR